MSTTNATSAPKPVESTAKPAQSNARAPKEKTEGENLFANLLGLLASAQVLPEAATLSAAKQGEANTSDAALPDGTDNPFAALLGWGVPGSGKDALGRSISADGAGLPGAVGSADRAATTGDGKIDISGMTPVEPTPLDNSPKGQVALPANAIRPGAPWAPTRATDAAVLTTTTSTTSTTAAPWRQGAVASTETAALQVANHSAQVRSTVALNERFGLTPGVALSPAELRDAGPEGLNLGSTVGTGSRAADAVLAPSGTTAGDANMGSDHTGSDANANTFDQTDSQANQAFADANATEEPTVTHWGTQHLRHASLRVGGEGDAQAIDIQLSMKGQEVQVAFNTDNAEARASLRENAGESLGDLLGKSGIQLGGVSVGSQGQPGSRGDEGAARQGGVRGVALAGQTPAATPSRIAQTSPRADGSQPLDVFA